MPCDAVKSVNQALNTLFITSISGSGLTRGTPSLEDLVPLHNGLGDRSRCLWVKEGPWVAVLNQVVVHETGPDQVTIGRLQGTKCSFFFRVTDP